MAWAVRLHYVPFGISLALGYYPNQHYFDKYSWQDSMFMRSARPPDIQNAGVRHDLGGGRSMLIC
jgi:hypothetical protein